MSMKALARVRCGHPISDALGWLGPIAAGSLYVISKRLGHASIRTTYDVYGHLFEGRDREAAGALEEARARSLADSSRTLDGPKVISLDP